MDEIIHTGKDIDNDLVFRHNLTTILIAFAFPIAIQGTYRSIKIALAETLVIYKLNLMQCCFFLVNVVVDLIAVFYRKHDCAFQFYLYQLISFISFLLIYLILFLKAYYASKSFKFIGVVFVCCQVCRLVGTIQIIRSSRVTQEYIGVCSVENDAQWPLLLLVSESIIVIFLSYMFVRKITTQSQFIPSKVYSMLIQHGFALPIVICAVNIVFCALIFSNLSFISVEHLLRIGWITNAWLIMKQTEHSHYLHKKENIYEESNLPINNNENRYKDEEANDSWDLYIGVRPS
ncbi:hypothetical protein K7432_008062 [Basidiobolus ranarum]|uniref:Uncharacterized protein n=1 Tax=Basidiobolus ranarum TaxID=34480 RepID=A0ABR2VZP7_9FUNG